MTPAEARVLGKIAKGRIGTVAVLVDPSDALLDEVAETVGPDLLQLHGGESPERVAAIKVRTNLPVMKAISIATAADVAGARAYAAITDGILFDAKADAAAELPGGNGLAFDWRALQGFGAPFALSGGLTPDTVANAVAMTGADLVDVSSGVERAPGDKDPDLVKRFIRAAKSVSQQARAKAS